MDNPKKKTAPPPGVWRSSTATSSNTNQNNVVGLGSPPPIEVFPSSSSSSEQTVGEYQPRRAAPPPPPPSVSQLSPQLALSTGVERGGLSNSPALDSPQDPSLPRLTEPNRLAEDYVPKRAAPRPPSATSSQSQASSPPTTPITSPPIESQNEILLPTGEVYKKPSWPPVSNSNAYSPANEQQLSASPRGSSSTVSANDAIGPKTPPGVAPSRLLHQHQPGPPPPRPSRAVAVNGPVPPPTPPPVAQSVGPVVDSKAAFLSAVPESMLEAHIVGVVEESPRSSPKLAAQARLEHDDINPFDQLPSPRARQPIALSSASSDQIASTVKMFDPFQLADETTASATSTAAKFIPVLPPTNPRPVRATSSARAALITGDRFASDIPKNQSADDLALSSKTTPVTLTKAAVPPPPPPKRSSSGGEVKVVQWDFDGSGTPGGLTVKQGEKVTVHSSDQLWCTVSLISSGDNKSPRSTMIGLVPKSYLVDPQMRKLAIERMPRRPAAFDYGKECGFARDLIAVRSVNGAFGPVTTPVVRFWGRSAKSEHIGDRVQVFIDGKSRSELRMGQGGVPMFVQTGLYAWDLHALAPDALKDHSISALHVRFEHICPEEAAPARFAECTLFVWNHDDDVVVSDVDGTITLSDVGGHLNTTFWQKAGYSPNMYAHLGVCVLYSFIRERFHCRFLYLTARPLNLCVETRNYLRGLKQDGQLLPLGPCVTDATSYYGSLRREVVDRSSHLFKSEFLVYDLRRCFVESGRNMNERCVFMAGFGNKDTDAMAYRTAGVHPVLIFSIDSRSIVNIAAGYASELSSYDDPNLKNWVSDMIVLFQNGKLPPLPT